MEARGVSNLRVFVSFDVDHDSDLEARLTEQSQRGGLGITVTASSPTGHETDRWCAEVRRRIRAVDQVIVLCGEHTRDSPRMSSELRIAQEEEKPCLFLWGRRERMCTLPAGAKRDGSMYRWTWETLQEQILRTSRRAQPFVVLEHEKRP